MKKAIQLAAIVLAFLPITSFAQGTKAAWPEMKQFHSLMAAAFHPSEEGDFAPLKAKSDSLFAAARTWQKSAIPANFKPVETKEALKKLVIKCAAVDKAVQSNSSEAELKKLIAEAHDAFHTIAGECRRADD